MVEEKKKITKSMTLGEVLDKYPDTAEVMYEHGLHCIGCHISAFETVEQGAQAHGVDVDKFIDALNKKVEEKKKKKE